MNRRSFFFLIAAFFFVSAATTWMAQNFPFQFDDAFISFRITGNLIENGKPFLFAGKKVYTSTSLLYPFLNLLPAWLSPQNWISLLPIWNGILLASAFILCLKSAIRTSGNQHPLHLLVALFLFLPWFLGFRNLIYGNSGLETAWYMIFLATALLPGGSPLMAPWLVLIRPEGWLAGWAVLLESLIQKNKKLAAGIAVQLLISLLFWCLAGWLLYGTIIPQSLVAKAGHLIDRWNEIRKGFSYLMFSGYEIPMALFIADFLLNKNKQSASALHLWILLYTAFFSLVAAWWPWYLPPLSVGFWYLGFSAALSLLQHFSEKWKHNSFRIVSLILLVSVASWINYGKELDSIRQSSAAFVQRKKASEELCSYLQHSLKNSQRMLLEPLGMTSWYGKNLPLFDYPGLANPEMSTFVHALPWKVPHRLTDTRTDSALLEKFMPDVLVLWPEEKAAMEKIRTFSLNFQKRKTLAYFPEEKKMDSVSIFSRIRN